MNYDDFKSAYNNLMVIGYKANNRIQKDVYTMIENLITEYPQFYECMIYEVIK